MESAISELNEVDLAAEIHAKLSVLDTELSKVFKSHTPVDHEPEHHSSFHLQRKNVEILRNLESTMDSLRNVNPMTLMKQLLGM